MSPDEHALLDAIAANPADDLPRLVYADWLDEHGEEVRAEFIRLQCEIARLQAGPREAVYQNVQLFRRQQEILDAVTPTLLGSTREVLIQFAPVFERGFLANLTLSAWDFLDHGPTIASIRPLPDVNLMGLAPDLYQFEAHPDLAPSLDIVGSVEMQAEDFRDPFELGADGVTVLSRVSDWPRLRVLVMEGCRINNEGLSTLSAMPLPNLIDLDLSGNNLTDVGVIDLLNSGLLRRLHRLVLGGNPLTDQSAFELADRLGGDVPLEYLNLRFTNIGHAGQQALLARFGGRIDLF